VSNRLILVLAVLVLGWAVGGRVVAQESVRIEARSEPLDAVFSTLRAQADIDIVYADRLVQGVTTSCVYEGSDLERAIDCALEGTNLRAERVRRHQYVLVAERPNAPDESGTRGALTGRVMSAETGERLTGAHVYLPSLEVGTTTNQDGYFVFSKLPREAYAARISYLGHRPVDTTLVAGDSAAEIRLLPTPIASEGVQITSRSTKLARNEERPGRLSVPVDQLGQLPSFSGPDLFQGLQWTPGVQKEGVLGGGLSVRGGEPDQNLYLLDGAPVYHPWHAFTLISTFQTGTLKTANLYRGGFPAQHGGRLSSVLDAEMKDGSRNEPTAEAALSVLSGRFRVETPLSSNTSFMFSGRRSYLDKLIGRTHPVQDENGRRDTLRTGYYFFDTSAKIAHRFNDRHRLSVSYYFGKDDLDLRLPFDLSLDFDSLLRPADLLFELDQDWQNRIVSAQHQYLTRDNFFVNTTAYYSGYRANEASFVQPTTASSLTSDYQVRLHDAGLKMDATYHHSVQHEVHAGLEISTLQFTSALDTRLQRSVNVEQRQNQESDLGSVRAVAYLEDRWTPSSNWIVRPGVRASYFSSGGYVRAAPRLQATYTVHPRWLVLNGSAGVQVQYLHRLRDRHSLAYDLVSSRWIPASDRVRPATGAQIDVGLRSRPHPDLTLELSTYLRGTRQVLVPTDVFQQKNDVEGPGIELGALLGQFTVGQRRAFGAEMSAMFDRGPLNTRLSLGTGRTFVRAPGQVQTGDRWRPADLDVPFTLRGTVNWNGATWGVTLATEWRTGYPITTPVSRFRVGDPVDDEPSTFLHRPTVNNDRLGTYFRTDLTLRYSFRGLTADWAVKLTLFNATDRENEVDRTFRPTERGVNVESQRGFPLLPLLEVEMSL